MRIKLHISIWSYIEDKIDKIYIHIKNLENEKNLKWNVETLESSLESMANYSVPLKHVF